MMFELISKIPIKRCRVGRCVWCGESMIGEAGVKVTAKFDGEFQSDRYHPECDDAVEKTAGEIGAFGFDPHNGERGKPAINDEDFVWGDW